MSEPRSTASYKDGVEHFLCVAFRDVPDGGKVLCPCVNCRNRITQDYDEVKTHLRCFGILQSYTKWVHHGEKYDAPDLVFAPVSSNSRNIPTSTAHRSNVVADGPGRMHDMDGLLKAVFAKEDSFESLSTASIDDEDIHFDNESAETNMAVDDNNTFGDNHTEGEQNMFATFLKEANTKLYHGCDKFSKLSFIVSLYHQKCIHGWTQESFTALLGLLSDALPQEAELPKNCYEAKKIIRGLGLDYKKIHACPKDCMLFRGDRASQESCHICGTSRWKTDKNGSPVESKGKKKPAKVLRYFPLITRLQRLFSTNQTSGDMRWHEEGRTKDGMLRHPADGEAWKDFDTRNRTFCADARNVRLGLASDGFNPFRNMSSKHSTWPVMLIPYNLPPWICMKQTSLILSMIISGPDSPGNDIDIYLEPLVDELLQLWDGVETYDASSQEKFSLRAALLWTLNDFPALAYLYGWSTGGKYACPSCAVNTRSFRLKKGGKFCYMGHRRWLPLNHKYHSWTDQFDGTQENEPAPNTLNGTAVLKMLEGKVFVLGKRVSVAKKVKRKKVGKSNSKDEGSNQELKRKRVTRKEKRSDCTSKCGKKPEDWLKKRSIFFTLPYWKENKLRHNLDVMHIEKNVSDNLIGTLLDIDSKTKDNLNARLDLVEIGIRPELHPTVDDKGKKILPPASFTMSREKKEILCSSIQKIKTPDGYASNISRCVNMKECTLSGMKSHDCHVLLEDILPIALRSCYPSKDVMKIVIELARFFKKLCSKVIDVCELKQLQDSIVMTLCDMERFFLPSFFTIMVHLLVHLVEEVKLGGPVHYRWMYPLERSFVRIKALVRNKAYPEGSIAEGYLAEECLTFCSRFLDGTTRFTRPPRNPDPPDSIKDMYMFGSAGEPLGKAITSRLDNQLLVQAHRYVLRHCDELDDFRKEFIDEEKRRLPQSTNLTHSEVDILINRSFADWLEQKVLQNSGAYIDEKIRALAAKPNKYAVCYSGYIINGFRFHTMSREAGRSTQNSGVVNIAEDGVNYYGRLSDVVELSYGNYKVVLFRCDWYDVHHKAGLKTDEFEFTLVNFTRKIHTGEKLDHDPFVFSSQVEQVFYCEDEKNEGWHVVTRFKPRDIFDMGVEQPSDENE